MQILKHTNYMKANSISFFIFVIFSIGLSLNSCKKNKKCDETKISSVSENSHNSGQNCMSCHYSEGKGEGCFNAAGSLFSSGGSNLSSGKIILYTAPNGGGTAKYTITVDQSGNFYSTESIDVSGLYPAAFGPTGEVHFMSSPISSGACNSCHGVSTGKIWSK